MNGVYGGLIVILMYAVAEQAADEFGLITQSGVFINTQTSQNILVQE